MNKQLDQLDKIFGSRALNLVEKYAAQIDMLAAAILATIPAIGLGTFTKQQMEALDYIQSLPVEPIESLKLLSA